MASDSLYARERAILELLDEVPTFHQADMLMDGLVGLLPQWIYRLKKDLSWKLRAVHDGSDPITHNKDHHTVKGQAGCSK